MSINESDFRGVDLNLLVTFLVLMRERSVSRAAACLYLGQPAVSGALARLRKLFDDELLVRTAHGMVPTARALDVAASLAPSIEAIQSALFRPEQFEPATDDRAFRLGLPDLLEVWLMPALLPRLAQEAPGIRVAVHHAELHQGMRLLENDDMDLGIDLYPTGPSWQRRQALMAMKLDCVYDPRQLGLEPPLSLAQYLDNPHLLVSFQGDFEGMVDRALDGSGKRRTIRYSTPRLAALPFILRRSPALATVPEYVAREWRVRFGLRSSPVPVRLPPFTVSMIWHARRDADAALRWLRGVIVDIANAGALRDDRRPGKSARKAARPPVRNTVRASAR